MLAGPRAFIVTTRSRITGHGSLQPMRDRLGALSHRELHLVELTWRGTRRPLVRHTAIAVSWLGNGLLYLLIGIIVAATVSASHWPIAAAALSIAVAHLIYPWVKLACARHRPFVLRRDMEPPLATLDEHSFPSGHAMTLCAASVPIVYSAPALLPAAVCVWLAMAWARIASAHHYPTDVIAGGVLGALISWPIAFLLLR